jgi:hypothetical protein
MSVLFYNDEKRSKRRGYGKIKKDASRGKRAFKRIAIKWLRNVKRCDAEV